MTHPNLPRFYRWNTMWWGGNAKDKRRNQSEINLYLFFIYATEGTTICVKTKNPKHYETDPHLGQLANAVTTYKSHQNTAQWQTQTSPDATVIRIDTMWRGRRQFAEDKPTHESEITRCDSSNNVLHCGGSTSSNLIIVVVVIVVVVVDEILGTMWCW